MRQLIWYMCGQCGKIYPSMVETHCRMSHRFVRSEMDIFMGIHKEQSPGCTASDMTPLLLDDDKDTEMLNRMYGMMGARTDYDYRPLIPDIDEARDNYGWRFYRIGVQGVPGPIPGPRGI